MYIEKSREEKREKIILKNTVRIVNINLIFLYFSE